MLQNFIPLHDKRTELFMTTIRITSARIAMVLAGVIFFLLTINLLIIYLHHVRGYEHLRGFIQGFYFDTEANIPSLYSAVAIVFCSVLLWLIGSLASEKAKKRSSYWKFLSLIFILLAMDEFGSLHEFMIQPLRGMMDRTSFDSDYLYFAWFIPYMVLLLLLGLVFLKFFVKLPSGTRWLFIVGGVVFLSGAVGMEMVGGKYWAAQGWAVDGSDNVDLTYALIITLEELLEMLGIVIFIYALTKYYLKETAGHDFLLTVKDAD
jgi:hypothetical protein